jgi:hypothetical protein
VRDAATITRELTCVEGGRLTEIWMVEAPPAHRDELWS